jgi:hypothetical protein
MRSETKLFLEWGEIPRWMSVKNRRTLIITAGSDWEGYKEHTITIEDVVEYYVSQAGNIVSGCRRLGSIVGDWRPIDNLAKTCLEVFKTINIDELRRVSKRYGLIPKF